MVNNINDINYYINNIGRHRIQIMFFFNLGVLLCDKPLCFISFYCVFMYIFVIFHNRKVVLIHLNYKQMSPDSVNHLKLEALQKVYRN